MAQRSAKAAKVIKSLITASGGHVRTGVSLVGQTGASLALIVDEAQEIDRSIKLYAIDQSTQQNAAMVEQSTAASHTLAREADSLNLLLSRFNLGEDGPANGNAAIKVSSLVLQTNNDVRFPKTLGTRLASAFAEGSVAKLKAY